MKKRILPKDREMISEALDIVMNTEDDEAAIAFLRDTLDDDYPDLDLGSMNLHEALDILQIGEDVPGKPGTPGKPIDATIDINKAFAELMELKERRAKQAKKTKKTRKTKKTKKTKKAR